MSPGKIASQAGHAYLHAFMAAQSLWPAQAASYISDPPGTKVCLRGRLQAILAAAEQAKADGIPHFLVVDSGCPDFFDGQPTVTALGLGPATKDQIQHLTRRFNTL